jgi:TonB-dependent starch-binding outer membrane protein SusC
MMKFTLNMILLILMLAIPWNGFGQSRSVSGTIKDAQLNPLPGVSIIIKGTTRGTTSDSEGKYTLQVDNDETTLVFSFVGFESQEVKVGNVSMLDISLNEDVTSLQEVIVIGYGEVKKSDLTGSVAKIKGGELNKVPAASVDQLLQGRAAGLQVINSSGEPGAGMTIRIRGLRS